MTRRALRIALGLLTAGSVLASLLYTPPQSRLSAIPAHAHIVYNSESPEWFLSFFPILGKKADDFSEVWKKQFQGLENRPLAAATVAFDGSGARSSWVAVSELTGPQATALRWRMMLRPPKGVSPARSYAVWPVWRFEHPDLPSWARVRFAVTERLLICSVSPDSRDIYRLLDTADGRAASLATQL